jgi:hypothetical protein
MRCSASTSSVGIHRSAMTASAAARRQALGLGPRGGLVDHVDARILEPPADEHPVSDGVFADEHPRTWHP